MNNRAKAGQLKEIGRSNAEIAKILGLTMNTVRCYVDDPEGKLRDKWRAANANICPKCGDPNVSPYAKICNNCNRLELAAQKKRWTRERVIGGLQRFYFEQGLPLTQANLNLHSSPNYPNPSTCQSYFGSWSAAVEAAGFPPYDRRSGPRGRL